MDRMNSDGLNYVDANIGTQLADGSFVFADGCADVLKELVQAVRVTDQWMLGLRTRGRLLSMDLVGKALVPLLTALNDEEEFSEEEKDEIFVPTIRLLADLSQPPEYTVPADDLPNPLLQEKLQEVQKGITKMTVLFSSDEINKAILRGTVDRIHEHDITTSLTGRVLVETFDSVLYLYRNLLLPKVVPKVTSPSRDCDDITDDSPQQSTEQLRIIGQLLDGEIDNIIMSLSISPQKAEWCIPLVQLLSLLYYSEENSPDTEDDVNMMLETSMGGLDMTEANQAELKLESESTRDDSLRNKIGRRLDAFAESFVRGGLSNQIETLLRILIENDRRREPYSVEPNYLSWLITRFLTLNYCTPAKLHFGYLRNIASDVLINFIVVLFQSLLEKFRASLIERDTIHHVGHMEKILPVVSALERIFKLILVYFDHDENLEEQNTYLLKLQASSVEVLEIRTLAVALLRTCGADSTKLSLLQESILLNHNLMLMADNVTQAKAADFDIVSFIEDNFTDKKMMAIYGLVLEYRDYLSDEVLMSVLSMMYHVAGDLDKTEVLMQASIVQSFIQLLRSNHAHLPMDTYVMMNAVVYKCADVLAENTMESLCGLSTNDTEEMTSDSVESRDADSVWPREERDKAMDILADASETGDVLSIDTIIRELSYKGIMKTRKEVCVLLLRLGVMAFGQCINELTKDPVTAEDAKLITYARRMPPMLLTPPDSENEEEMSDISIKQCLDNGQITQDQVDWLQATMKDFLYIRMALQKPCPLVAHTEEQAVWSGRPGFSRFLCQLGFKAPVREEGQYYHRFDDYGSVTALRKINLALDPVARDEIDITCEVPAPVAEKFTADIATGDDSKTASKPMDLDEMRTTWNIRLRHGNQLMRLQTVTN